MVGRMEQSEDSNRKLMGKLTGGKLVVRMEQSENKGPVQSFQQAATVEDNEKKSPTPFFGRKEVQKKQNIERIAAKQKDPSFSQNREVIKEKINNRQRRSI